MVGNITKKFQAEYQQMLSLLITSKTINIISFGRIKASICRLYCENITSLKCTLSLALLKQPNLLETVAIATTYNCKKYEVEINTS